MTDTIDHAVARALALHQQGQLAEAEPIYRDVLARAPQDPQALALLGTLCLQTGREAEAAERLGSATQLKPGEAGWLSNLGLALRKLERYPEGEVALRAALALKPQAPETLSNLGLVLHQMAEFDAAVDCFEQAIALRGDMPGFHVNLGTTFMQLDRLDEAVACFRRAVELQPRHLGAQQNLGLTLFRAGRLEEAETVYRHITQLVPANADGWRGLGKALRDQGRMQEAITAYEQALELEPDNVEAYQGLLFNRNYLSLGTPREALAAARGVETRLGPVVPASFPNVPDPERRLRVGLLSADFKNHPVGQFVGHLLPLFDRQRMQVIGFANQSRSDGRTLAMQAALDGWHVIHKLGDEAVEALIRDEAIDILVDLSGHTGGNRMRLLSRRPAPVQATWLGYSGTTGLSAIDYIIADASIIPPGDEAHYAETPIRLPHTYLCYDPPEFSGLVPEVAPTPALRNGFVTFGTYNNAYKISDDTIACWARVLEAVPGSRLLLKHRLYASQEGRQAMASRFARHGVDPARLLLKSATPSHLLHFQSYGEIDIGLDPFPYNGTTTTGDSLWMGVPVITLLGDRFISRVGASMLRAVGLGDLVAPDIAGYVEIARGLASDLPRLSRIRANLRPGMMASPLGDAPGFARDFEAALRSMWQAWCESRP